MPDGGAVSALPERAVWGRTSPLAGQINPFTWGKDPSKLGRRPTPLPKLGEPQTVSHSRRHLQDHWASMPHDLGCHVDDPPAHGGGISANLHHLEAHVLLEGLVEKKGRENPACWANRWKGSCSKPKSFDARCTRSSLPRSW